MQIKFWGKSCEKLLIKVQVNCQSILTKSPLSHCRIWIKIPVAFSGVEFIILISVMILCLFYRFGLALAVLLGGLLFYQKVGIRDPKTGQSWVVARKKWHQYCRYNNIDWKRWREQSRAEAVAVQIKKRQAKQ